MYLRVDIEKSCRGTKYWPCFHREFSNGASLSLEHIELRSGTHLYALKNLRPSKAGYLTIYSKRNQTIFRFDRYQEVQAEQLFEIANGRDIWGSVETNCLLIC